MFPPIFKICSSDTAVKAALGTKPTRLYAFGDAPQDVAKPYAVWQIIGGLPSNFINQVPDIDSYMIQVDVYAENESSARQSAEAIRDAIEPHAYVQAWRGEFTDGTTMLKRYSFDISWFVNR